jgi:DinB superfamily
MKNTIENLREIIAINTPELRLINEQSFIAKPRPEKWSKKEILGHLIDSAQTNIRRFVVSQYEDTPKILYQQDEWVRATGYNQYPTADLINLWSLLNNHICIILSNMPAEVAKRKCATNDPQPHTIEWLAADYVKHLLHHLHQIRDLEALPYP